MKTYGFLMIPFIAASAAAASASTPAPAAKEQAPKAALKTEPAAAGAFKTEDQKTLYALGVWLGQKVSVFNLNASELKYIDMGIKDTVLGNKPQVDLEKYGAKINELAQSRVAAGAEKEKARAKAFVEKAAKETGAKSFPSGLIFNEIKAGKGASPKETDTVKVHYEGTLTNGAVFDSSIKRGQPAEFPLNNVIKCWTEGVQKMKVGGKAKLVCPSSIAYGDMGHPPTIPGGATLVFQVELLDITKK